MKNEKPVVAYAECMACGACVQVCPFTCLALDRLDVDALKKAYPILIAVETCTGCGICADACPVSCIQMCA